MLLYPFSSTGNFAGKTPKNALRQGNVINIPTVFGMEAYAHQKIGRMRRNQVRKEEIRTIDAYKWNG
jgi:hypothetical protein